MISARTGRRWLMMIIVLGFASAFLTQFLLGKDGAVSEETSQRLIDRIMKTFVPLFGIIGGFFFSERGRTESAAKVRTTKETFVFAAVTVSVWALLPTLALAINQTFNGAIRLIDKFDVFGTTIAVAALTYYFSTSAPAKS